MIELIGQPDPYVFFRFAIDWGPFIAAVVVSTMVVPVAIKQYVQISKERQNRNWWLYFSSSGIAFMLIGAIAVFLLVEFNAEFLLGRAPPGYFYIWVFSVVLLGLSPGIGALFGLSTLKMPSSKSKG